MNEWGLHTKQFYGAWQGRWKKRYWGKSDRRERQKHRKERKVPLKKRSLLLEADLCRGSAAQMQQFLPRRGSAAFCNWTLLEGGAQ